LVTGLKNLIRVNKGAYILLVLLFCTGLLFAQDAKLSLSASKTEVGTGEQFEIDFSFNGNAEGFNPPNLGTFQVLAGPNISQSVSSINGVTTMSSSYSYVLMPTKEGEYTIGPATIVTNGKRVNSNTIKIKVVKGRPVTQQAQAQSGPDPRIAATSSANLGKNLFLREVIDKDNVYQGQQIVLTYRIYTRVNLLQSQMDKLPDLTGFFNEETKTIAQQQNQQVTWRIENYKGQKYNVADIKQVILYPEHAGNITIDPFQMTFIASVPVPSSDPFEQMFGGSTNEVKYPAKSPAVVVHVKPLPDAGKPAGYSGAIGMFTITAGLDKNHIKANEPLNYKVKVTGSGNIKLLKNLNTGFPVDFEKYDPKIADTTQTGGLSGSRTYTYLLIPRHGGNYTIEPLKFSYFNPATGKYVTLTTAAFPVKVDKGATENNVTALAGANKQDVKLLDKDIRYIKTGDADLSKPGDSFFGSAGYYLLVLLGPVLCFAAFSYRNYTRKINSDVIAVKSRKASKMAAKHMANAQTELQAGNKKTFYEAVFKGLYGYLSDKLNISAADLNREVIAANLKSKSVSEGVIKQLLETLDLCEMARYAPVTNIAENEVFEKAKGIIDNIENEI
jgi:hypothetical protein